MYSSDVPFTNGKYVHEKEYGWFSSPYSSLYKSNIISDSSSIHFFHFSFYSLIQSQKPNSISLAWITVLFSLFFITLSLLTSLFLFQHPLTHLKLFSIILSPFHLSPISRDSIETLHFIKSHSFFIKCLEHLR